MVYAAAGEGETYSIHVRSMLSSLEVRMVVPSGDLLNH